MWDGRRRAIDGAGYAEVLYPGGVDCMAYCYGGSSTIEGDNLDSDMRFVAEARTLVPELVAECAAWRAVAATRQAVVDGVKAEKRVLQREVDRLSRPSEPAAPTRTAAATAGAANEHL